MENGETYEYQVSRTLPDKAPSYVTRQADLDLYKGLEAGELCYVFKSRHMGKSSLEVRARKKLQEKGFVCALLDLSAFGTQNTADQWYASIIDNLAKSFDLHFNLSLWWKEQNLLPPLRRFGKFIEEILLNQVRQNIIISIDEIDTVLSLNFPTSDFFAFIRYCYNQRANNPEYKRLTFAIIGVATPSDLIEDKSRTPFNIGRAIELNGFKLSEVKPLVRGLEGKVDQPQAVIGEILKWTGGQPFLTQKLCQLIVSKKLKITSGAEAERVKHLVETQIIQNWESQDEPEHLRTIRNRIFRDEKRKRRLLSLYEQILKRGQVPADNSSPEQIELRLSGIVVHKNGGLEVYNRIYQEVFNKDWIDKEVYQLRPYAEQLKAWLASNQDSSLLLRGKALEDATAWAEGKDLGHDDYRFLSASLAADKDNALEGTERQAIEKAQELVGGGVKNPLVVIEELRSWTGNQPDLTLKLLDLVFRDQSDLEEGSEEQWVENLVRSCLIENWKTQEAAEPLRKIRDRLIKDRERAFWLLESYKKIIVGEELPASESLEKLELLDMGLVSKQQGQLQVSNPIYKEVFNLTWVDQELLALRPYAEKFKVWLKSNSQDKEQLLDREELQGALVWVENGNKGLDEEEYKFLIDSLVWNN
ncbi:MAG TPA: hypothetical protein DDZ80_03835 [Cyanobacteria bacterium UBA8803]|nr:hypothetical protein [Cyanobacteria bacterium UBA9273]HBL57694.1 hypothetical protein [Cyanobacteria bacterium UBA8803]